MSAIKMKYVLYVLMVFSMVGVAGCILTPEVVPPEEKPKPTYKDLTHVEDVVTNLVQCYKEHNINRYKELLHDQYEWHNQDLDVQSGAVEKEFNTRDEEIATHTKFFQAAEHQYPDPLKNIDRLELNIADAPWIQIIEFENEPCEDCWTTTRIYDITVEFAGGASTLMGNDLVLLTVVPIKKNETTYYRLRRADDIKK